MFGFPEGVEYMLMDSAEKADAFIKECKKEIKKGTNPEFIEDQIYDRLGISPADFTPYDKERITREVNEFWEEWNA